MHRRRRSGLHLWPGSGANPRCPADDGQRARNRAEQRARRATGVAPRDGGPGRRQRPMVRAGPEIGRATSRSTLRSVGPTAPTGAATAPTGGRTEPAGAPGSREHPSSAILFPRLGPSAVPLLATGIPTWASSPAPHRRAATDAAGLAAGQSRRAAGTDPGSGPTAGPGANAGPRGDIRAPGAKRGGRCGATARPKRAARAGAQRRP